MKLAKHRLILCLSLAMTLLAGCAGALTGGDSNDALRGNTDGRSPAGGREVPLGEEFKLEKDETVSIKGTNLTVELKSVRRTWYVDGKSETVDADIVLTLNGNQQRQWMSFKSDVKIGEYSVTLTAAYPFGKTNAKLVVRRFAVEG